MCALVVVVVVAIYAAVSCRRSPGAASGRDATSASSGAPDSRWRRGSERRVLVNRRREEGAQATRGSADGQCRGCAAMGGGRRSCGTALGLAGFGSAEEKGWRQRASDMSGGRPHNPQPQLYCCRLRDGARYDGQTDKTHNLQMKPPVAARKESSFNSLAISHVFSTPIIDLPTN
jgi:hypothetical protein